VDRREPDVSEEHHLHLQGQKVSQTRNFHGLLFDPEDGGNMFWLVNALYVRNISWHIASLSILILLLSSYANDRNFI
jgi:hypothetical protein